MLSPIIFCYAQFLKIFHFKFIFLVGIKTLFDIVLLFFKLAVIEYYIFF